MSLKFYIVLSEFKLYPEYKFLYSFYLHEDKFKFECIERYPVL